MPRKKMIKVSLGQLTQPLKVKKVQAGTTLKDFLSGEEIDYNSRIRVNALTKTAGYTLKADDIITVVGEVSGGR